MMNDERLQRLVDRRGELEKERESLIRMALADMRIPLQFMSNVIELKPDGKYLFVFKGDIGNAPDTLTEFGRTISRLGCVALAIHIPDGASLDVFEVPEKEK